MCVGGGGRVGVVCASVCWGREGKFHFKNERLKCYSRFSDSRSWGKDILGDPGAVSRDDRTVRGENSL